jgi:hypothetical protein
MKKFLFIAVFFLGAVFSAQAQTNSNHVYVQGYTKSNGTYVNGHWRTAPNNTINDNFSTYPNVNPYNGKVGTIAPSSSNSFNTNSSYYNTNSYFNNTSNSIFDNNSDYYYNNPFKTTTTGSYW